MRTVFFVKIYLICCLSIWISLNNWGQWTYLSKSVFYLQIVCYQEKDIYWLNFLLQAVPWGWGWDCQRCSSSAEIQWVLGIYVSCTLLKISPLAASHLTQFWSSLLINICQIKSLLCFLGETVLCLSLLAVCLYRIVGRLILDRTSLIKGTKTS